MIAVDDTRGGRYRWQPPRSNRNHPTKRRAERAVFARALRGLRARRMKGGGLWIGTEVEF